MTDRAGERGTVYVEDRGGEGTRFVVALPAGGGDGCEQRVLAAYKVGASADLLNMLAQRNQKNQRKER